MFEFNLRKKKLFYYLFFDINALKKCFPYFEFNIGFRPFAAFLDRINIVFFLLFVYHFFLFVYFYFA